jgi:xanthine/uracil/vitamin C permease (AzgA family)
MIPETQPNLKKIALNNGLLLALAGILLMVIMYVLGIQKSIWINILSFAISIALLYQAINTYKHQNGGFLSMSEGLKVGLATVVIASLISAVYTYIHFVFISPETIEIAKEESYRQIMENASMTQEQKEQSIKVSHMMTTPFLFATVGLIMGVFFGFLISLVVSALLRKKRMD